MNTPSGDTIYDVIIIGGGPAGLSAAIALGRSSRSVLIIDSGRPRNAPAAGVHNFLTRDGVSPAELLATGRAEAATYGAHLVEATATAASRRDDGFRVILDDGTSVQGRRLLVATGLVDELPDILGLTERWGNDVLHCPYCHGWEVRGRSIGILATGPMAMHQAQLFRQLSQSVTFFLHAAPEPSAEELEELAARGIRVVSGRVESLTVTRDALTGVLMEDGTEHQIDALVVAPTFTARAGVLTDLGLEATAHPFGVGTHVESDEVGQTAVPGVWAVGNVTDLMAQVVTSAAAGLKAGATINADLIAEEVRAAVASARGQQVEQGAPDQA
ncbi:NAD(P)/FAD-dependent oxidoreductase [Glaciibacter superstes]|uniref:NAD(P)/FAD-dependent oxidoreductase n=1 Tax=Glaciibacter superstes TaxID=501023 RepID=UPI0003B314F4|nr:NAD(P)/FAD-dependent oxidoreductase [Glaciibacter superstes]